MTDPSRWTVEDWDREHWACPIGEAWRLLFDVADQLPVATRAHALSAVWGGKLDADGGRATRYDEWLALWAGTPFAVDGKIWPATASRRWHRPTRPVKLYRGCLQSPESERYFPSWAGRRHVALRYAMSAHLNKHSARPRDGYSAPTVPWGFFECDVPPERVHALLHFTDQGALCAEYVCDVRGLDVRLIGVQKGAGR